MAWAAKGTSDALTLDEDYDTILESSADMELELNPGEGAIIIADVDFQANPTENCDMIVQKSVDGTEYESDGESERHIILTGEDPAERAIWVADCHTFRIRARVRDPDDSPGTNDSSTTLTIHYRLNGIDA